MRRIKKDKPVVRVWTSKDYGVIYLSLDDLGILHFRKPNYPSWYIVGYQSGKFRSEAEKAAKQHGKYKK